MDGRERRGASAIIWILLLVALVVIASAGYFLTEKPPGPDSAHTIDLAIVETNPVLQLDHFFPDIINVTVGENVTLAIQNGDDELRVLTLSEFDINVTIPPGTADRVNFAADTAGNFSFFSPKTPPSAVSQGRLGPRLDGTFDVTPVYAGT
jgi:hypothetical protein